VLLAEEEAVDMQMKRPLADTLSLLMGTKIPIADKLQMKRPMADMLSPLLGTQMKIPIADTSQMKRPMSDT
jgi:hypothetical protein